MPNLNWEITEHDDKDNPIYGANSAGEGEWRIAPILEAGVIKYRLADEDKSDMYGKEDAEERWLTLAEAQAWCEARETEMIAYCESLEEVEA